MKKTLALILAAVMALSLVACAKTPANGGTEAKGSVYYLNFKPEAADQWPALAKEYTKEKGSGQDLHRADRRGGQGRHRRFRPV